MVLAVLRYHLAKICMDDLEDRARIPGIQEHLITGKPERI